GDESARKELLNCACARLLQLTRKMLKDYTRLKRWEQTDDVLQNAAVRLYRTLGDVTPATAVDFFRLAALSIRREPLDLAKHYDGPQGHGANYATLGSEQESAASVPAVYERPDSSAEPGRLAAWTEFHRQAEQLPEEERELFDLLWYQGLTQSQAAELLQVSERTIKRRWQAARLRLHQALGGELPQ